MKYVIRQRDSTRFVSRLIAWVGLVLAIAVCPAQLLAQTAPAVKAKSDLGAQIIAAGRDMVRKFPNSSYSHKLRIEPAQGICEVDCSGFVATVVEKVSPRHIEVLPLKKKGRKRPLAEDFYSAFVLAREGELPGWQTVRRVEDARPGDVLAWYNEEHEKGENTGHVMLIDERPVADGPGKWRLRVLDSTGSPHAKDTRPAGKIGLGSGTIWLDVDKSDRILGYHWKNANSKLNEHPAEIGRAVAR